MQAGETSLEAVKREVSEETGLDVSRAEISLLHTYRNDSPRERNNYFVDIYHICLDFTPEDVHPQESETDGFRLADYEEIKRACSRHSRNSCRQNLSQMLRLREDYDLFDSSLQGVSDRWIRTGSATTG